MTLSNVFRAMAVFMGLWGVGMLLVPETVVGNWNWELTEDLAVMTQFMGTMMVTFAFVHWKMPAWAGDNLKSAGITFGVIQVLFLALNIFHLAVGNIPSTAENIGGVVPAAILTALFFVKSR
ncbi:MAG TPA: hypothetical protein DCQ06_02450 [Myxococcales bacterium]|nr:hypothetical protein [Myxococcales bacterium]HAN30435.1 hypothetical protein [Myxococcales bacterium]